MMSRFVCQPEDLVITRGKDVTDDALALKDFNPSERRDEHGRWTDSGGMRHGMKTPASISRDTNYPSMMSPDEQANTFGFHISSGGDAVPGGYNGYLQAKDPETDDVMGYLDYQTAGRPYYEGTVAMVKTEPKYKGHGVATNLLQAVRAEYPEYEWSLGMVTDEGAVWKQHLPEFLQQEPIPALRDAGKSLHASDVEILQEVKAFDPNQRRDRIGRWTREGGGGLGGFSKLSKASEIIESLGGKHGESAREALGKGAALDTQKANQTGDGKYTPHREALHRDIIDSLFKDAHPSNQPTAVFTAGGAASGKSGLAGQSSTEAFNLPTPPGHVYINPDEIKKLLPEYNILISSGRDDIAAAATHEESSDLAKLATAIALENQFSVVIDGTGNSHVGKFGRKLKAARDMGYKVEVRYAHVTVTEALAREKIRAEKTGRKVGESTLRGQHRSVVQSFQDDVRHIKGITVKVYSTATRGKPSLIAEQGPNGKMRVVHQERYAEHLAKAAV